MDVVPVLNKASLHAVSQSPWPRGPLRRAAAPSLTEVSSGAVRAVFVGMDAIRCFVVLAGA